MTSISNSTRTEILAAAETFATQMESDPDALAHYGVKGMKWGVRNEETLRKYGLSVKRAATSATGKLGSSLSGVASGISSKMANAKQKAVAKKVAKRQMKENLKAQRRELGMKKRDFDKLRETTLKSHDPRVVAKGMHTLTDEELKTKIKRLQEEDKISKMATSRSKSQYEVKKARNEALGNNPIVQVGQVAARDFVNKTINELGYNTIVKKGLQPPLEQRVVHAARKAQNKFAAENPDHKVKWAQKNKPGTYNKQPITGRGMKSMRPEYKVEKVASSSASSGAVSKYYGMKPMASNSSTMAVGKAKVSMSDVKSMTPAEWNYKVSRNPKYDGTDTVRRTEVTKRIQNAFFQ